MLFTILCIISLHSSLKIRFPDRRPIFQEDEFGVEFYEVWAQFFVDQEEEHDDFMRWFLENACPFPKRLAVEQYPDDLLVCAHKCDEDSVPVISTAPNGTRVRACRRVQSPPPSPPKKQQKKKRKKKQKRN